MKSFNRDKVIKLAIDKTKRQQIYIADKDNRELVIQTLIDMGFSTDEEYMASAPDYQPILVNTLFKTFISIRIAIMACAVQSGAKTINYNEMLNLIEDKSNNMDAI